MRALKKWYIWLGTLAAFFAVWLPLRTSRTAMNALCGRILLPAEQALARLCVPLRISVAEVLVVSLVGAAILYAGVTVRRLITERHRIHTLLRFALTVLCSLLTVYALFCLLWGSFYNTDSFQNKSGITARGGTVQELTELTAQFADGLAACADEVPRDADGCFAVERDVILKESTAVYENIYGEFPFLRMQDMAPKAFCCSKALSYLDFTGFYFPFTGEANVNIDSPAAYLPATVCHEMAHQRGISSEQECNFVGILASVRSDDAAYRYSGYLMGYVYLANALYRTDREAWQAIRDTLPEAAVADIHANSVYWLQFQGPVNTAATAVYDGFLKANGDENGVQSYGTVVDMLIAYFA